MTFKATKFKELRFPATKVGHILASWENWSHGLLRHTFTKFILYGGYIC
jgi:hypothetical protein